MKYYLDTIEDVFKSYFTGQGKVAMILAVLYSLALWLLDIKYGIVIGILAGLLSIIPYLGFTVGIIAAVIAAAVQYGVIHVLYVIGAFAAIQLLESFVISPKIIGKSIGINPLVAFILLFIGSMAFGPLGLIISIPLAGILFKIYKDRFSVNNNS